MFEIFFCWCQNLTTKWDIFWWVIAPVMAVIGLAIWVGAQYINWSSGSKAWRIFGLIIGALALMIGWFVIVSWLQVDADQLKKFTEQTAQQVKTLGEGKETVSNFSWLKLALSAITLGLALLCLRIALKASFFRDWRLTASKDKPYWHGSYWPGVIFSVGFFPSLIWMIWSPTWYLVPVMWFFWRTGSWPVGRKAIERWVPQFNEHLFPNEDSRERFGKCYFFGKEAPQPDWFQLLFGVPFCLPLSSVTVIPWEVVDDSKPTGLIPTQDGSMVNVSVRVRMLTCDHPSVVMELSGGEVSSTIDGSFGIVMNDVPDLVVKLDQKTLRSEIDKKFTEKELDLPRKDPRKPEVGKESKNDRIRRKVLLEKGNRILSIDFGAPIPAEAIAKAMENAAASLLNRETSETNANTAAKVLEIETAAKVAAQKQLFMAEANGVIDEAQKRGERITLQEALALVIQRHQADATRTVIAPGVGLTMPVNPQQP